MEQLFSQYDLTTALQNQEKELKQAVEKLGRNDVLAVSESDLVAHLVSRFSIEVPQLHREGMHAEDEETRIDVSHHPDIDTWGGQSVYRPGTKVTIVVPFSGEADLFGFRPNSFNLNPPRGAIGKESLSLVYNVEAVNAEQIKNRYEGDLSDIEQWLTWQRNQVTPFNTALPRLIEGEIAKRRERLLASAESMAALGLPIRRRGDPPSTFVLPDVKRKPKVDVPRPRPTESFVPEPTLALETYDEILKIIGDMAQVMEQSPHAFAELDEEALRFHFLVPLNGHFEGGASGETFNYEGKTDILVRSQGRIVFVAECKFWKGAKAFVETIDQIRGYLSWRDTKAAILLFVRNRNFSSVVDQIVPTVEGHAGWKKTVGQTGETSFRFIFGHRDDPNREITLTVLLFPVPLR